MNVLLLEDEPNDAELIRKTLNRSGIEFNIHLATDKKEFTDVLDNMTFDVILSDNSLPQFSAFLALKTVNEKKISTPFILVTGTTSDEFAVDIMKEGAADYILKDRLHRLPSAILMATNNYKIENERQKHLAEIIKSEALMKEAERLAHFGSWEVDRLKNIYHWSDQYYRILDYEIGEVPPYGSSFYNRVHPDDLSYVKQTIELAIHTLNNHGFDCRVVSRDGKIKYLYNRIHVLRDEENRIIRINGFSMDITDTKVAEELVKKTELNYKRVVDNIIDALIIDDLSGKVVYANDQFLKIFGLNKEDIANLTIEDYVAPEYRKLLRGQHNLRVAGEKAPSIFEFVGIKKDGERRWIEVRVSKVYEFGKIIGTQAALRDITKAKIEEQLRLESQANLRAIFDNTDIGFILLNSTYKIVSFNPFVNKFALDLLERKFIAGKFIANYFKGENQVLVNDSLVKASNGRQIIYESEFQTHDGINKWYSFSYNPILNNGNEVIGVLMTMREITSRKILELQGQKIKDDLLRRNNDLEQFAYIISHNLRSPVASILGLTNLLIEHTLTLAEAEEVISDLNNTSRKLDDIIKDINKILSINKDVAENKETVVFSQLTEAIVYVLQNNFEGILFTVIADFAEKDEIYSLKSYMHSIFINLISNSIKYRKPGVEPRIEITSKVCGSNIILVFKDNGIGIDLTKNEKRVFGLYNRFHNHVEGKGMGLFMVKTQVELLGGKIVIKSAVNEGCEIKIEFPMIK